MSVDERLRRIFADVFGIDPAGLDEASSPQTIEGWDSVTHLNLVLALEGEFGIQFEAETIPELVSFGLIRERVTKAEPTIT